MAQECNQPLQSWHDRLYRRLRREEVHHYAGLYTYDLEATVEGLVPHVKACGHLTKLDLVTLGEWKTPRIRPKVAKNDEETVRSLTSKALATSDSREALDHLWHLNGVGMPVASCILHWFHRDPFPIVDARALWTLGLGPKSYTLAFWQEYVALTRGLAQAWQVDMRTLDRALWKYSEAHSNVGAQSQL